MRYAEPSSSSIICSECGQASHRNDLRVQTVGIRLKEVGRAEGSWVPNRVIDIVNELSLVIRNGSTGLHFDVEVDSLRPLSVGSLLGIVGNFDLRGDAHRVNADVALCISIDLEVFCRGVVRDKRWQAREGHLLLIAAGGTLRKAIRLSRVFWVVDGNLNVANGGRDAEGSDDAWQDGDNEVVGFGFDDASVRLVKAVGGDVDVLPDLHF